MSAEKRLFVSIDLPDYIRDALEELMEPMPGAAWVRRDQLHLTLRFIGDADLDTEKRIREALASLSVGSFLLPLRGVGVFPPRAAPRLLWVGLGNGHPRLFQLQQKIEHALISLGIEAELRRYHPHITLARLDAEAAPAVERFLHRHAGFEGPPFRVSAFSLTSSRLGSGGAAYSREAEFPLEAR